MVYTLIILSFFLLLFPSSGHSVIGAQQENVSAFEEMIETIPEAELRSVYRRLNNAGFDPGDYEEHDLEQLAAGLEEFQKFAKLPVTGRFDVKTWQLLTQFPDPQGVEISDTLPGFDKSTSQSSPQPEHAPSQQTSLTIQWPPVGIVKMIQEALNTLGYQQVIPNDDIDDIPTKHAILHFQQQHGLPTDGTLHKETGFAILNTVCQDGCAQTIAVKTDPQASVDPHVFVTGLQGKNWETIYIQGLQKILIQLGYDPGSPEGTITLKTREALRLFQQDLNYHDPTGDLDDTTALALVIEGCQDGCEFHIFVNTDKKVIIVPAVSSNEHDTTTYNTTSSPDNNVDIIKPMPTIADVDLRDYPVNAGDQVFAVETVECSKISGGWVIFYQGTAITKDPNTINLRLEKRFGYRYHPEKEGEDQTDWWCAPARKHCYSEILFNDWGGRYVPNQTRRFPTDMVSNAKIQIPHSMSFVLEQACHK